VDGKPFVSIALGASYQPGNWFVMSEWSNIDTHSSFGDSTGWYVSDGYRFGKFTPYITYGRDTSDNLSDAGLTVADVPPFLAGPAAGLNAALNTVLSSKSVQNTISVGARWDLIKNVDLKLEVDHTRVDAGSNGGLVNLQPGFQLGSTVNLFSVSVDFVF
jgi:predicted porin